MKLNIFPAIVVKAVKWAWLPAKEMKMLAILTVILCAVSTSPLAKQFVGNVHLMVDIFTPN